MRMIKRTVAVISALICVALATIPVSATANDAKSIIQLTDEEKAFIERSQNEMPVTIGIIPHAFPLSDCPPNVADFTGLNVEMLRLVEEVSGLTFSYKRVNLEQGTPYQALQKNEFSLVAGTIKLHAFLNEPNLLLSNRLCDGSSTCIARRDMNLNVPVTRKVAVMSGYQAGKEFAEDKFSKYEIVTDNTNQEAIQAVRKGKADVVMLSTYVGLYELQNPQHEKLIELTSYQVEKDSCVMGLNNEYNQLAISVINKSLNSIGEDVHNYVQMNFSIANPYKITSLQYAYKYRYAIVVAVFSLLGLGYLTIRLMNNKKEKKVLILDSLTGALSEVGFELTTEKVIQKSPENLFITDFDISNFSGYNELHGKELGSQLLKDIVAIVKSLLTEQNFICRTHADHFVVLSSNESVESLMNVIRKAVVKFNEKAKSTIALNFGIYPVTNRSMPITKMLDFAAMTKKDVKENSENFIGVFDEALRERYIREVKMISEFKGAIARKEFVAYYQPKIDAKTKLISGAEALVRWKNDDGTLVPPIQFIELFERSGQVQQLDFYMLEEVCLFLNCIIAKGMTPFPIAVNFSRVHLYSDEFVQQVDQIVESHSIPKCLIEIECTETTMINDIELTKKILGMLQEQGFSIAMDDFGSAYFSLNALCSMPLDVIKLDSGFLRKTLSNEEVKVKTIISSVMILAHSLFLKIVAEGVETEEQYLFLKGLGCDIIQGYYFSRPLEEKAFLEMLGKQNETFDAED